MYISATYSVTANHGLLRFVQNGNGYLFREESLATMRFPNGAGFRHDDRLQIPPQFLDPVPTKFNLTKTAFVMGHSSLTRQY
jgi:hypothetical protein